MRLALLTLLAALLAACGDDAPTSAAIVQATPQINFQPGQVEIAQNGAVTWEFGAVPHNVFFTPGTVGRPQDITGLNTNTSIARTFATLGTFQYECGLHPGMRGTVVVRRGDNGGY